MRSTAGRRVVSTAGRRVVSTAARCMVSTTMVSSVVRRARRRPTIVLRPMAPVVALVVPVTVVVVIVPVCAEHERDDRDADLRPVCVYVHALVVVRVLQVLAG